jgi:ferritin
MLNKTVSQLIVEQINKELYSAYLYLDMADYYSDNNLVGFENWFFVQAQEERDHAMLFRRYLLNGSEKITLAAIAAPNVEYVNFKTPLTAAYDHELTVTASINNIYAEAYQVKDFRTMQFLDWFVREQGEEEKNTLELISKFDLFGSDPKSLYMLNQELAARMYAPPSLIL